MKIKSRLKKVLKEFNDFRSPLITGELVKWDGKNFKIRFEGAFSFYCCMDEYFLDFLYELEAKGINAELVRIKEKESGDFLVSYKITKIMEDLGS